MKIFQKIKCALGFHAGHVDSRIVEEGDKVMAKIFLLCDGCGKNCHPVRRLIRKKSLREELNNHCATAAGKIGERQ